jgi:hypothetical protein
MGRSLSLLFTLACIGFMVMVYDNVYSDLAPIQAQAEAVACTARSCDKRHGVTKIDRNFLSQRFELRWEGEKTPVVVSCTRAYFAVGARECHTE